MGEFEIQFLVFRGMSGEPGPTTFGPYSIADARERLWSRLELKKIYRTSTARLEHAASRHCREAAGMRRSIHAQLFGPPARRAHRPQPATSKPSLYSDGYPEP